MISPADQDGAAEIVEGSTDPSATGQTIDAVLMNGRRTHAELQHLSTPTKEHAENFVVAMMAGLSLLAPNCPHLHREPGFHAPHRLSLCSCSRLPLFHVYPCLNSESHDCNCYICGGLGCVRWPDRKSTRLNSSHWE